MEDVDGGAREEETAETPKPIKTDNGGTGKADKSSVSRKGKYIITAYCPCVKCCGKSNGITASGAKAVEGVTIAADTKVLPFGTKIIIDGNTYTVQDRGGAVKGNRIDIFFDSHDKALQFGRQTKEIIIIE